MESDSVCFVGWRRRRAVEDCVRVRWCFVWMVVRSVFFVSRLDDAGDVIVTVWLGVVRILLFVMFLSFIPTSTCYSRVFLSYHITVICSDGVNH